MKRLRKVFKSKKPVIGMIHVQALPGTPGYEGKVENIINMAKAEAKVYRDCGIDAVMIENMHDVPYLKRKVGPEIISMMSVIGYKVKNTIQLPCGIQILAGANREALAAAKAASLDFIRAEGFVYAHIADEGLMESDAGELLRYRNQIDAENILIFTDIKKKHSSHSITSDVNIVETAKTAEFFLSDGVIITGKTTGGETDIREVQHVKKSVSIPVIVGSGVTEENVQKYFTAVDAFIIGSYLKIDGDWKNTVDPQRVKKFMKKINSLR